MDVERIAYNIKYLREQHNLTQSELSERLMTSRSVIAKWENNVAVPDIVSLAKLSHLFGVSIDYIVGNYTLRDDLVKDFKRIYASDTTSFDDEVADLVAYFMSHPSFKNQLYQLKELPIKKQKAVYAVIESLIKELKHL